MKTITGWIILGAFIWLLLSWFANSVGLDTAKAELNDTATSVNILPNKDTTSSSLDNFNLDGVQTGSAGSLTNNSTHNGFTITCTTQVNNECGKAFNGELEGSADMTVSYSGSLLNVTGTDESGNTHTSNQKKLDGGVSLINNFSVQNCEHSSSSYRCGQSDGAVDSYTLSMKIKDNDGNVLSETTITRVDDSGYNANSLKHTDTLSYNETGSNMFDWSWSTIDGSGTNNGTKASNLLGAELNLEFATEEYEPLTLTQIEEINNVLETTNFSENQISNVISKIENQIIETVIEEKFEVVIQENLQIEILTTSKEPEVKEIIEEVQNTEIVNVIKEEVIIAIEKEKAPEVFAKEIIEEVIKEELEEEILEEKTVEPKEEKEETKTAKKEEIKEEKKETKKVVKKTKEVKSSLDKKIDKVDLKVKDNLKNIEVKNIIISDALINNSISLVVYEEKPFYKPKDIYLNQMLFVDNRKIYENINLATYTVNDPIFKKEQTLRNINLQKQKLLIEIGALQNGH